MVTGILGRGTTQIGTLSKDISWLWPPPTAKWPNRIIACLVYRGFLFSPSFATVTGSGPHSRYKFIHVYSWWPLGGWACCTQVIRSIGPFMSLSCRYPINITTTNILTNQPLVHWLMIWRTCWNSAFSCLPIQSWKDITHISRCVPPVLQMR